MHRSLAVIATLGLASTACAQSFVNWESPQVHPLDVTPGGGHLLAVNTADNRLEVFQVGPNTVLVHLGAIPVGLDPVSVRARTDDEVWVVNRISDSVSVIDLDEFAVVGTLLTDDDPADVVFAQQQAFVSTSTFNRVDVFDLPLLGDQPTSTIDIAGEDPWSLLTDGTTVSVVIRNAGNGTGVIHHAFVTDPGLNPYAGAPNPPPNFGNAFEPPINPDLLVDEDHDGELDIRMPPSAMIIKQADDGSWSDDNGMDWSSTPFWSLHLHAVAHIDAASHDVTYTNRLMTSNLAAAIHPTTGELAVVGIHAFNHVRFVKNLRSRFVQMGLAVFAPGEAPQMHPLNPHLASFFPDPHSPDGMAGLPEVPEIASGQKAQTLGDPRGVVWSPDGSYLLTTGRGTNMLVKAAPTGQRLGQVTVGAGPTGVVVHPVRNEAYVLNQFDASCSVVDLADLSVSATLSFHDPTPGAIVDGRPVFYDTHLGSRLGQASCQSCHLDGKMDLNAWDLGEPEGEVKPFDQVCIGEPEPCLNENWHPMKGPMTTQTLQRIIGQEPLHWRGDKATFSDFNGTFNALQGTDELTDEQMTLFESFVATLAFPPNPFRELDNSLSMLLDNGGDAQRGELLFMTPNDPQAAAEQTEFGHVMMTPPTAGGTGFNCVGCHALPFGSNNEILRTFISDGFTGIHHLTESAPLMNLYRKDGFDVSLPVELSRSTGFMHDGGLDTIATFLSFFFGMLPQDILDMEAFLLSFGTDTHAGVGAQVTVAQLGTPASDRRDQLIAIAEDGSVNLVVRARIDGRIRGLRYLGAATYQSDRVAEVLEQADLDAALGEGPQTYTLVPAGSATRIGLDRDEDGYFDRDELDECADPADPDSVPGDVDPACCAAVCEARPWCCDVAWAPGCIEMLDELCPICPADITGDGVVNVEDLIEVVLAWGPCPKGCSADITGDLQVDVLDLVEVVLQWGCVG